MPRCTRSAARKSRNENPSLLAEQPGEVEAAEVGAFSKLGEAARRVGFRPGDPQLLFDVATSSRGCVVVHLAILAAASPLRQGSARPASRSGNSSMVHRGDKAAEPVDVDARDRDQAGPPTQTEAV